MINIKKIYLCRKIILFSPRIEKNLKVSNCKAPECEKSRTVLNAFIKFKYNMTHGHEKLS